MGYCYPLNKLYTLICSGGILYIFITYFLTSQKHQSPTNIPFSTLNPIEKNYNTSTELTESKNSPTCQLNMTEVPKVDIQMLDVYRKLDFDNKYGGVWTQGWDITYSKNQWNSRKKLKVFVVPHSHNDPGWLNTFEDYYHSQTQYILSNMVLKLPEDKRRKFIWAEISYFKLWWDEQSEETRKIVKKLITDGQLEIVSGGWVMPDEAVSHWMAQLTQLTEGHQWLKANLDYQPSSSWAIDPFGLSPTMPYLYKNSGLKNVLIQRVHYSVKKYLAKRQNLEFKWRQLWDNSGESEILTHLMPFVSYDIRHSCGPDPDICEKFDFSKNSTTNIDKENVEVRAGMLLDQFRKKSQLYRSNVILVPLGDDFTFKSSAEWKNQYENYEALFEYMNKKKPMHVEVQFGTLTDYFNAVKMDQNVSKFPSLSGDFFTYSDRDDNYWSGYYTSRPFHKRLDRVLLDALRRTEIIAAISWAQGLDLDLEEGFEKRMDEARQWHSLFQHHDGVTGTARDDVVVDYAKKMIAALDNLGDITQKSAANLLGSILKAEKSEKDLLKPNITHKSPANLLNPILKAEKSEKDSLNPILKPGLYFSLDEVRSHHTSIEDKYILSFGTNETSKQIVVYNSLPRKRSKVQTLIISTPFVKVTNAKNELLECQISPIWNMNGSTASKESFELSFVVTAPGFGLNTYTVHFVGNNLLPSTHFANVTLFNVPSSDRPEIPGFKVEILPLREFSITQGISAHFAESGLLKSLQIGGVTTSVNLEFVKYSTSRSGAYLFAPSKPNPDPLYTTDNHVIHLVTGPILSRVFVQLPQVNHTCTLFNSNGSDGLGLRIDNQVDVSDTYNFELVMRLKTNISSGDEFFTDLNGLNIIKRQKFEKLPTQANYYPLPAIGYIQDEKTRLTVVTGQPLGAASMAPGQFEIMQDRRLNQDDARGLAQGVKDNLKTNHIFMIVLEKKEESCFSSSADHPAGMLSIGGLLASEEILHPLVVMHQHSTPNGDHGYRRSQFSPLNFDLPIDLAVSNLRVIQSFEGSGKNLGAVFHRHAIDTCWNNQSIGQYKLSSHGEINVDKLFRFYKNWTINEASLTFNSVGALLSEPTINLCPHQISAFILNKP